MAVDHSRTPGPYSIVIVAIDGELTVRPFSAVGRQGAEAGGGGQIRMRSTSSRETWSARRS